MKRNIKAAYIGGGSKEWAMVFMNDLCLDGEFCGELALYDIDKPAAERNAKIGQRLNALPDARSAWEYTVHDEIGTALAGADFVLLSILPGDFTDMRSDVHEPERYGIYQSVGDTTGPGGILRAMRTVPLYEEFAREIQKHCPRAWVINLTNPMSICVKTLYDVFPGIRAFGCCHEVFHAQDFLCLALERIAGAERPERHEIYTDASGINHFTWITEAHWRGTDLLALLPELAARTGSEGIFVNHAHNEREKNYFADRGLVKMDLYKRYGALGAAGDRHLAEFVNGSWYLKNPEQVAQWGFMLTDVDYRVARRATRMSELDAMADGSLPVELKRSKEELVALMKAIAGFGNVVSNVNMPNAGQMSELPLGSIVETNCVFSHDCVKPIVSRPLPHGARALVQRTCAGIDTTYEGIKNRDLKLIFAAFADQPACSVLDLQQTRELFAAMVHNTGTRLAPYFNLEVMP